MKATFFTVAAFAAVALAAPHHKHQELHDKRDVVETDWFTQVDVVTATAPAAYVYVDQYGNRINEAGSQPTTTVVQKGNWGGDHGGHGAPWSSTNVAPVVAATPETTPEVVYTPPVVVSIPAVSIPVAYTPPVVVASSQAPASTGSSSSGSFSKKLGVSYSPYKTDQNCKSASEVASDLALLKDYPIIRIYGTDCNQVANVLAAAAPEQKLFLGVFHVDNVAGETKIITDTVKDWSRIDTVSVGNEVVNSQQYPVAQAVAMVTTGVNLARTMLRAAGFNGPVVIVDTFNAILANPSICENSDYAAANCHAFFNSDTTAASAGAYVQTQAAAVAKLCNKRTVITESGWPSSGQTNGAAVPGQGEQATAVSSIEQSFSSDLFLFSAYNDAWKKDFTGSYGAEHFWGILGTSSTS